MASVEFKFEVFEDQDLLVATFKASFGGLLEMPYSLVSRLLKSSTEEEFRRVLGEANGMSKYKDTEVYLNEGITFVSGIRRERFRIKIMWRYIEFFFYGPLNRSTGEEFWFEHPLEKLGEHPYLITVDHSLLEEGFGFVDHYRPFASISVDPSYEEEGVYFPHFVFHCVDRDGYYFSMDPNVLDYDQALEMFKKSFLLKFISVFLR